MRLRLFTLCGWALLGCSEARVPPLAELGVYYGGQIQELQRVPLSSEPGKQRYGFRIELPTRATRARTVRWEIQRPARYSDGTWVPAQAEIGREEIGPAEQDFRKIFSFETGAPAGTWNFRVLVEQELVLDRAIEVYEEGTRTKLSKVRG